jgi:hypothetical protein
LTLVNLAWACADPRIGQRQATVSVSVERWPGSQSPQQAN